MGLFDKHMVVSAYREEIEYKLEYGMEALDKHKLEYGMETLDKRFCDSGLPMILDIQRPNYRKDFRAE